MILRNPMLTEDWTAHRHLRLGSHKNRQHYQPQQNLQMTSFHSYLHSPHPPSIHYLKQLSQNLHRGRHPACIMTSKMETHGGNLQKKRTEMAAITEASSHGTRLFTLEFHFHRAQISKYQRQTSYDSRGRN